MQRIAVEHVVRLAPENRVGDRNAGAGDRRAARSAIGLQHVAIDAQRPLAQRGTIDDGAKTAADQALNFLRAPRLLAFGRFTPGSRVRRARQHAVLGRDPAFAAALEKSRHALFDACRAKHPRIALRDQHRALGVLRESARDDDRP